MTTTTTTTDYAGRPPKKKRTGLKIFLGLMAFGVIAIVAMMALIGTAANEVSKSIQAEQANDKPFVVTEGKAEHDDGQLLAVRDPEGPGVRRHQGQGHVVRVSTDSTTVPSSR